MRDISSCFSDHALNLSHPSSCSANPSLISSRNLTTPIAVSSLYRIPTTASRTHHLLVTLTWARSQIGPTLRLDFGQTPPSSSSSSSPNFKLNTSSRLFHKKKKGGKTLTFEGSKIEILYDFSSAKYDPGPEPSTGFYVAVLVDSELGLALGDLAAKRLGSGAPQGGAALVSRRERVLGRDFFATRARFSDPGEEHEILIQCRGEEDGLKHRVLSIWVDRKSVICVKRLEWNFRGNQAVFVDGLVVDMMWDVHDWFFDSSRDDGSRSGVFMFKTRKGSEGRRLWWDSEQKEKEKSDFCLFIYACKTPSSHHITERYINF